MSNSRAHVTTGYCPACGTTDGHLDGHEQDDLPVGIFVKVTPPEVLTQADLDRCPWGIRSWTESNYEHVCQWRGVAGRLINIQYNVATVRLVFGARTLTCDPEWLTPIYTINEWPVFEFR